MTVAPFTCILDPAAAIAGRTELNLNLDPIAIPAPSDINWGESQINAFLAQQLYGEAPSDFRIPNRIVEIPLVLGSKANGTEAEEEEARAKLQQKVGLFQRQGGVLLRQRANGEPLYADIVNASLTLPDVYGESGGIEPGVILKLECLPDFYGDEITLDTVEGTGNIAAVLQLSGAQAVIKGDYPGRTRIVLTEKSKHDQRSLLWGFRSTRYSSAATAALFYDAYKLEVANGSEVVNLSGAYSGKGVELKEPVPELWYPFLTTDFEGTPLTHVGSFRMFARCSGLPSQSLRLAWSEGDATSTTYNAPASIPTRPTAPFEILDLGEIRIEQAPVGEGWWRGILQLNTGGTSSAFQVDRIWLQPLDDGAGKLRATAVPVSLLLSPSSEPAIGESNNSLVAGKAWTNPTHIEPSHVSEYAFVELAAGEQSAALVGKKFGFSLPTGAVVKGIEVTLQCRNAVPGLPPGGGLPQKLRVQLLKAGALAGSPLLTELKAGPSQTLWFEGPSGLWETTWTAAQVNAEDFGVAIWFINTGGITHLEYVFYPLIVTVYYIVSETSVTEDAVLYSERVSEMRFDGAYREDTSTSAYTSVSEITGDLARIPPSGLEARAVQLFIKNSRGLLSGPSGEPPEQDAGIDAIQAQVHYRPAYIGRI